jgi:hypothetical protein
MSELFQTNITFQSTAACNVSESVGTRLTLNPAFIINQSHGSTLYT